MSGSQGQEEKKVRLSTRYDVTPSMENWFRHSVTFPAGEQFGALFKKPAIFVDKTMLIAKPRRWGKSTNMNMLKDFFEIKFDKKTGEALQPQPFRAYFENGKTRTVNGEKKSYPLAIAEDKQKWQNQYAAHQGAYPVIYMTWAGMKCSSYQQFLIKMKGEMSELFRMHKYLKKSFDPVADQPLIQKFKRIQNQNCNIDQLTRSLALLSGLLSQYRNQQVIILIDEYDYTFNFLIQMEIKAKGEEKIALCKVRNEVANFLESLLTYALKTNPHVFKGILTGILDFLKLNWSSGLNCVQVYGVADLQFSKFYGFSFKQIKQQLLSEMFKEGITEQQQSQKEILLKQIQTTIKQWYNGYKVFDPVKKLQLCIYNPYGIIRYLEDCFKLKNPAKGNSYWSSTSTDTLLTSLFQLQHKSIHKIMRLNTTYPTQFRYNANKILTDLKNFQYFSQQHLSSFLLCNGYITGSIDKENLVIHALLPNLEIQNSFSQAFSEWAKETEHFNFAKNVQIEIQSKFYYKQMMEKHVLQKRDYIQTTNQYTFNAHLAIAYAQSLYPTHTVGIQVPSGSGRVDNIYTPIKNGYVIIQEFKVQQKPQNMEKRYFEALLQIYEKNYFKAPFFKEKVKSKMPRFKIRPVVIVRVNEKDDYYMFLGYKLADFIYQFYQIQILISNPKFLQYTAKNAEKSLSKKQFNLNQEIDQFLDKIRIFIQKQKGENIKAFKSTPKKQENMNAIKQIQSRNMNAIKQIQSRNMTPVTFNYATAITNLFGPASRKNVEKKDRISIFKSKFHNSTTLYHCTLEDMKLIFWQDQAEQLYNQIQIMKADPLCYMKQNNNYDLRERNQKENEEKEEREQSQQSNSPQKEQPQQIKRTIKNKEDEQ